MVARKLGQFSALLLVEFVIAVLISRFTLFRLASFPYWSGAVFFATSFLGRRIALIGRLSEKNAAFVVTIGEGMSGIFTRFAASKLLGTAPELFALEAYLFVQLVVIRVTLQRRQSAVSDLRRTIRVLSHEVSRFLRAGWRRQNCRGTI